MHDDYRNNQFDTYGYIMYNSSLNPEKKFFKNLLNHLYQITYKKECVLDNEETRRVNRGNISNTDCNQHRRQNYIYKIIKNVCANYKDFQYPNHKL